MDLALNYLQRMICHKTQPTNPFDPLSNWQKEGTKTECLSDSKKSPLVFRTFLRILTDFNNVVVCMVSRLPLIFSSASLFSKPLDTVPSIPTIIGITLNFMFYWIFF